MKRLFDLVLACGATFVLALPVLIVAFDCKADVVRTGPLLV